MSHKRPQHAGSFSGTSSGGRGQFSKGHHVFPHEEALPQTCQRHSSVDFSGSGSRASCFIPFSVTRGGGHVVEGRFGGRGHVDSRKIGGCHVWRYVFLGRPEAVASNAVIRSMVSFCHRDTSILFDPGSTYSYVSLKFAPYLDVPCGSLLILVHVSSPVGDSIMVDPTYRSCVVTIRGYETRVDLLLLNMVVFYVILAMDWLSAYHAIFDCHTKTVTLAMTRLARLEWRGSLSHTQNREISFLKAQRMDEKECLAYLAFVRDVSADTPTCHDSKIPP
nr:uncharacterized protein LOC117280440 [Nicotiana tomentosiformis]